MRTDEVELQDENKLRGSSDCNEETIKQISFLILARLTIENRCLINWSSDIEVSINLGGNFNVQLELN